MGISFSASELQSKGFQTFISDLAGQIGGAIPEYQALIATQADLVSQMDSMESSGQKNSDAYKQLESQLKQTKQNMETMATSTESPIQKYAELFGSVEGLNAMMVLYSEQGMKDYNDILLTMGNSMGLTEKAYDKMNHGVKDSWQDTWIKMKNTLVGFGDFLAPYVSGFLDKAGSVLDYLNSLDDDTKKLIVTAGLFAAATGPVLLGTGKLISTGQKLITGMGTVSTMTKTVSSAIALAQGAAIVPASGAVTTLAGAFTALTGPVGLAALGIAGATAAGYAFYKSMQDEVVPQVDLFADKVHYTSDGIKDLDISISDSTKNAVQAYLDLDQQATQSLQDLSFQSTTITQEQKDNLINQYEEMKNVTVSAVESRKNEEIAVLQRMFSESSALTQEEENQVVQGTIDAYAEKEATIEEGYQRINEIIQRAVDDHRDINLEEKAEIAEINQQMKEETIRSMSENQAESAVILERLKEYDGRITSEMASERIKQLNQLKEDAVAKAQEQYDEEIRILAKKKYESGKITQEQYDALVKDAQKRRDETIAQAETTKQETVKKIVEMNGDIKKNIDLSTGDILTKWGKFWGDFDKKNDEYLAKTPEDFKETGSNAGQGLIDGVETKYPQAYQAGYKLGQQVEKGADEALDINSPSRVFKAIGHFVSDGLAIGIEENADGPINEMLKLAKGVINTGNEISTGLISVNEETGTIIYEQAFSALMDRTNLYFEERDNRISLMTEGTDETISQIDREIEATQDAYDIKMKLYEQEMYAKLALIDDEVATQVLALKRQIDDINDLNEEDRRNEATAKYEKQLAEKEAAFRSASTEQQKLKTYQQIQDLKADREKQLLQQQRKDEQDALRDQITDVQNKAKEDKAAIKDEYEAKKYQLEQQKTAEVQYLKEIQEKLKEDFKQRKELEEVHTKLKDAENKKRTTQEKVELKNREKELITSIGNNKTTLQNFTTDVRMIGNKYGELLLGGFTSTEQQLQSYLDSIVEKADKVAQAVRDAEEGVSPRNKSFYQIDVPSYKSAVAMDDTYTSFAADNARIYAETTAYTAGMYENQLCQEKQKFEIDYEKLAEVIVSKVKPSVKMENTFVSPKALSEREIKRNQELQLRELAFLF